MTARDPAVQSAMDRAASELARRIRGNPAPADPDAAGRDFIEWCAGQGLRFIPPPHPALVRPAEIDPETTQRGAALARDGLARRRLLRELTQEAIDADSYDDPGEDTR